MALQDFVVLFQRIKSNQKSNFKKNHSVFSKPVNGDIPGDKLLPYPSQEGQPVTITIAYDSMTYTCVSISEQIC